MNRSQDPDALDHTAASVRLEPHPADERLGILRIERPPLNAFDRVLDDADVLDAAIAEGLAYARGPLALRYAKQAVDAVLELGVSAGLALEADLIATCFASEDGQHGLRSFVENGPRKATFHGR
jgi:hypothetical protein